MRKRLCVVLDVVRIGCGVGGAGWGCGVRCRGVRGDGCGVGVVDTLQECCEHYTDLVMRRHIRNCVVLFQVAAATAWVKAGGPEQPRTLNVRCEDFTADGVQLCVEREYHGCRELRHG